MWIRRVAFLAVPWLALTVCLFALTFIFNRPVSVLSAPGDWYPDFSDRMTEPSVLLLAGLGTVVSSLVLAVIAARLEIGLRGGLCLFGLPFLLMFLLNQEIVRRAGIRYLDPNAYWQAPAIVVGIWLLLVTAGYGTVLLDHSRRLARKLRRADQARRIREREAAMLTALKEAPSAPPPEIRS